jgi:hypothetical protein
MAVRATDDAFCDLALDPAPPIPARHHYTKVEEFCPANVIKLQNPYIALPAVGTRVAAQVRDHILSVPGYIILIV